MHDLAPAERNRLHELAADLAGIGVWRLDFASERLTWSPQMFVIWGLAPGAAPSVAAAEAHIHPDDREFITHVVSEARAGREARIPPHRIVRPDGEVRHVETRIAAERTPSGEVTALYGLSRDITGQVRADERLAGSEARYRVLADSVSDIVIEVDAEDRLVHVSPSCAAYGYAPADLIGRSGFELCHPEDLPRLRALIADLFTGAPPDPAADRTYRLRTAAGGYVWMEGKPTLVRGPGGEVRSVVSVLRDISRRRALEDELHAARQAAEAAALARAELLENLAHEIRNPLSAVVGAAHLLTRLALPDRAVAWIARIVAACQHLMALVDSILDVSRADAGRMHLAADPVDPAALAQEALGLVELQAQAKRLTLALRAWPGVPSLVLADALRVRQVLTNLLANAVKFTPADGAVTVTVLPAGEGRIAFEVADTGPGIPAEAQARLFTRWSQESPATARAHGGAGLGLAISSRLAEAMGGAITLTSLPGQGAAFRLDLPAPRAT